MNQKFQKFPKHPINIRTNDEFVSLLEDRRNCNDSSTLRELGTVIKNMRNKFKNYYFSKLARNINIANETRKIEEEFRLCKNLYDD